MARRTTNFADPTCQFWLVFARSPFQIFKKVRIILRPKFTNLNFAHLPSILTDSPEKNLKLCKFPDFSRFSRSVATLATALWHPFLNQQFNYYHPCLCSTLYKLALVSARGQGTSRRQNKLIGSTRQLETEKHKWVKHHR